MALTLHQLCRNTEKLFELKLLAGKNGMDNIVRWVHMVEDTEVPDFLHGQELVFTTGIAHHNTKWIADFAKNLKSSGASGLVLNIGPYITEVPPQVIVFCEQNDFPLFTIPWKTRIIDITYEFSRRIISNEKKEQSLADAFKNLIYNPQKTEDYENTLRRAAFKVNNNYVVISLNFLKDGKPITKKIGREYNLAVYRILKKSEYSAAVFFHDNQIIAIRQNDSKNDLDNLVEKLLDVLSNLKEIKYVVGVSNSMHSYYSVPELYKQASAAVLTAHLTDKICLNYDDIGVYKILLNVRNYSVLADFCNSALGKLKEYDENNKTDYCSVLREYLYSNSSVQAVAEKTSVHRNTVNYKIKQIKEILGIDLNNIQKSNLLLAFYASDILDALNKSEASASLQNDEALII
ncbi:MAG: PucR family transcriptional regulator [Oscillospiraceae bacterium]